jgi:hypothetical protein
MLTPTAIDVVGAVSVHAHRTVRQHAGAAAPAGCRRVCESTTQQPLLPAARARCKLGRPPPPPQRSSSRRAPCAPSARCRARAKCRHQGRYSSTCAMCATTILAKRATGAHTSQVSMLAWHTVAVQENHPGKSWKSDAGQVSLATLPTQGIPFLAPEIQKWPPDVSLRAPRVVAGVRPAHLWRRSP